MGASARSVTHAFSPAPSPPLSSDALRRARLDGEWTRGFDTAGPVQPCAALAQRLQVTHHGALAGILDRRLAERERFPTETRGWVFPSELSGSGHLEGMQHLNARIGEAGGAKFWFPALRNCFISVADRDLMLPASLTKRLVNHSRPQDVTEGYAADWTMEQLRDAAQRIADRIDSLICNGMPAGAPA